MSQAKDIYNKVVEVLEGDSTLSGYVDQIYERYRDNIES